MNQQELDHEAAVNWIAGEMLIFETTVGQQNASAAVTSAIMLAAILRAISPKEQTAFSAEVDLIYKRYNDQFKEAA